MFILERLHDAFLVWLYAYVNDSANLAGLTVHQLDAGNVVVNGLRPLQRFQTLLESHISITPQATSSASSDSVGTRFM